MSTREQVEFGKHIDFLRGALATGPTPDGAHQISPRKHPDAYRYHFHFQKTEYYITYKFDGDESLLLVLSLGKWKERYEAYVKRRLRD